MEANTHTKSATTQIICNPELAPGTMLFGLGSLKDLNVKDDYKNDTLVDQCGRPFRKFPQSQLQSLKQRVQKWNRKQQPTTKPAQPTHTVKLAKTARQANRVAKTTPTNKPPPKRAGQPLTQHHAINKAATTAVQQDKLSDRTQFAYDIFSTVKFDTAEKQNDVKYFR